MTNGKPTKDQLFRIRAEIRTARDRSQRAHDLIEEIIAAGSDDLDAYLLPTCESVEAAIRGAIIRIHRYHP